MFPYFLQSLLIFCNFHMYEVLHDLTISNFCGPTNVSFYLTGIYGGILLPPTCKINYVNMQHNYVHMRLIYVNMQHNYVNMRLIYVNMRLIVK